MLNDLLSIDSPPPKMQPLAELPALVVVDASRDVRGCEIRSETGQVLGIVSDLLADPDRLVAEFLVVSPTGRGKGRSIVPVSALATRAAHLIPGSGLQPIKLRYRSTTLLAARAALTAVVLVVLSWWFRVPSC